MAPAAPTSEDHQAFPLPSPLSLLPSSPPPFTVAVIGLGLIGSAASRHLSLPLGSSLVAIGPPEPPSFLSHHGPFSSHFDQGRLCRVSDPDPIWASLASRSMARYAALQRESGIAFHHPVGSLRVSPFLDQPGDCLRRSFAVGRKNGAVQKMVESAEALRGEFPCFEFQGGEGAIVEKGKAGYINPRALVSAQLAVAERRGACIVREAVREVVAEGEEVRMVTEKGRVVVARRVVVCAGAYTGMLLARPLDLRNVKRTVLLAEVPEEEQERLAAMPTFVWRLRHHSHLEWVYGCPPVRYPDGTVALKVGGTAWHAPPLKHTPSDIAAWFQSDSHPPERQALHDVLLSQLMPTLQVTSITYKPCMVSFTAHHRPYIDAADGGRPPSTARIFIATGGCGAAAKSSDEIGRMAAHLTLTRHWASDMDASLFRAVFVDANNQSSSLLADVIAVLPVT